MGKIKDDKKIIKDKEYYLQYFNFILYQLRYDEIEQIIKEKGYKLNCNLRDIDRLTEKDITKI